MSDLPLAERFHPGMSLPPAPFRANGRFACLRDEPAVPAPDMPPEAPPAPDPLDEAFARGFDEGFARGLEAGRDADEARDAALAGLGLAFARLDRELEQDLRLRLRETVTALCEATLAPLALDEGRLLARVETAAAMLARADDERVIRLHPDDLALLSERLRADWSVEPDPGLERGALRVEGGRGGIEDGPDTWRRAIAEALRRC